MIGFFYDNGHSRIELNLAELEPGQKVMQLEISDEETSITVSIDDAEEIRDIASQLNHYAYEIERSQGKHPTQAELKAQQEAMNRADMESFNGNPQ